MTYTANIVGGGNLESVFIFTIMANNAYYFSHDSNAKDDPKCMLLIDQLGLEGYGIFWILIEVLREQPEYRYPIDLVPILARRYNTTAEKMSTVIRNYGLFQFDEEKMFFSLSLNKRMDKVQIGINQRRNAGLASAQKRLYQGIATPVERPLDECSTKKRKEKKGNEIKLNENTISNFEEFYPFDEFWNDYDKKVGNRAKLEAKWAKISINDRRMIKEYIPKYKVAQIEKKYRKNPETFLNNQGWNDEIISDIKQLNNFGAKPKGYHSVNEKWGR